MCSQVQLQNYAAVFKYVRPQNTYFWLLLEKYMVYCIACLIFSLFQAGAVPLLENFGLYSPPLLKGRKVFAHLFLKFKIINICHFLDYKNLIFIFIRRGQNFPFQGVLRQTSSGEPNERNDLREPKTEEVLNSNGELEIFRPEITYYSLHTYPDIQHP